MPHPDSCRPLNVLTFKSQAEVMLMFSNPRNNFVLLFMKKLSQALVAEAPSENPDAAAVAQQKIDLFSMAFNDARDDFVCRLEKRNCVWVQTRYFLENTEDSDRQCVGVPRIRSSGGTAASHFSHTHQHGPEALSPKLKKYGDNLRAAALGLTQHFATFDKAWTSHSMGKEAALEISTMYLLAQLCGWMHLVHESLDVVLIYCPPEPRKQICALFDRWHSAETALVGDGFPRTSSFLVVPQVASAVTEKDRTPPNVISFASFKRRVGGRAGESCDEFRTKIGPLYSIFRYLRTKPAACSQLNDLLEQLNV